MCKHMHAHAHTSCTLLMTAVKSTQLNIILKPLIMTVAIQTAMMPRKVESMDSKITPSNFHPFLNNQYDM